MMYCLPAIGQTKVVPDSMVVMTPTQFLTGTEKIILGEAALREVERLEQENAALLNRIVTKDSLTASLRAELGYTATMLTNRNEVISNQETIIKKLGTRVKRWGIGPQVGYGFSTGRPGVYIGIGAQFNMVRW